jgi:hypothetical protein
VVIYKASNPQHGRVVEGTRSQKPAQNVSTTAATASGKLSGHPHGYDERADP